MLRELPARDLEELVPQLQAMLERGEADVKCVVLDQLCNSPQDVLPQVMANVMPMLEDSSEAVQKAAASVMTMLPHHTLEQLVPKLEEIMQRVDDHMKITVLGVLQKLQSVSEGLLNIVPCILSQLKGIVRRHCKPLQNVCLPRFLRKT